MELEAKGAKVIPVFAGGLDFSVPVEKFFFDPLTKLSLVDSVLSLTGFALVGGPARQDHPRAIEALKKLNVPYMVSLPLVFQTTEEWTDSTLGLHPVQVALQVALPELDGAPQEPPPARFLACGKHAPHAWKGLPSEMSTSVVWDWLLRCSAHLAHLLHSSLRSPLRRH